MTYYEYFRQVSSTPFVDFNGKGGIKLPYKNDFTIGKDGVPVCKEGRRMNHDGSEPSKHRIKYRCPLASRKYGCSCEHPCSDSKYGRTVHVAMKDNPRLFTNPPRVYFSYSFFLFWIISTFQGSVSSSAGMINQDSESSYILVLFNVCANVCFFCYISIILPTLTKIKRNFKKNNQESIDMIPLK